MTVSTVVAGCCEAAAVVEDPVAEATGAVALSVDSAVLVIVKPGEVVSVRAVTT
ncbi:MAG: hypothetical protein ACKOE9_06820 [Vulcanococcus sp.]